MGERRPRGPYQDGAQMCAYEAQMALLLSRTILAERIWDVSKAIDLMVNFPEVDMDKIMMMGNSGGGTATFYTACYDERIKLSAPSCAFCPYPESIMDIYHCACNYINGAYRYFDMQDLAVLIAPRKLVIINGEKDEIFPIEGTKRGYETVKKIYEKAGATENCKLAITPKHHYWCPDVVWDEIKKMR
jgi:dienelactone hydrolase